MQNDTAKKYDFSLTTSSLRIPVMLKVAEEMRSGIVLDIAEDMGGGSYKTGRNMHTEIKKRLSFLTEKQLDLFLEGGLPVKKQIAFLSVCKCFDFVREFVVEVLREKYLIYDYQINDSEFRTFFRKKNELHPEMDSLTDNTRSKIRQVTFKILEQADIIDSVKSQALQPQLLNEKTKNAIVADNPQWLKIFFYSDTDIANA